MVVLTNLDIRHNGSFDEVGHQTQWKFKRRWAPDTMYLTIFSNFENQTHWYFQQTGHLHNGSLTKWDIRHNGSLKQIDIRQNDSFTKPDTKNKGFFTKWNTRQNGSFNKVKHQTQCQF